MGKIIALELSEWELELVTAFGQLPVRCDLCANYNERSDGCWCVAVPQGIYDPEPWEFCSRFERW